MFNKFIFRHENQCSARPKVGKGLFHNVMSKVDQFGYQLNLASHPWSTDSQPWLILVANRSSLGKHPWSVGNNYDQFAL